MRITLDDSGRLSATGKRDWVAFLRAAGPGAAAALRSPDEFFGEFDALSPAARGAVLRTIGHDHAASTRFRTLGRWHTALERSLQRASASLRGPGGKFLLRTAYFVSERPQRTADWLRSIRMRTQFRLSRRPPLAAALAAGRSTPRVLTSAWARGVPLDPRYRSFGRDAQSHNVYAQVIGLDLIPHAEGWSFIEANLNQYLFDEYFDVHPVIAGVFAFARAQGFRRIIWTAGSRASLPDGMLAQICEQSREQGIAFTLYEDARAAPARGALNGSVEARRSVHLPHLDGSHTLSVRLRGDGVAADYIIDDKSAMLRTLTAYQTATGDRSFRADPMSAYPSVPETSADRPTPNLVYKYPWMNKSKGVFFMKVRTAEEALEAARKLDREQATSEGMFEPFWSSRLLEGNLLYNVRAFVLVTPLGCRFLGAIRRQAITPVPNALSWGIVREPRPFLVSVSAGDVCTHLDEDERREAEIAALGVARGIAWGIRRAFAVSDDD